MIFNEYNVLILFSEVMENVLRIGNKYGPEPFKFWLGTSFAISIIKPEDLQVLLFN